MLGDYIKLLRPDHTGTTLRQNADSNWQALGWAGVNRAQFVHQLNQVRLIRNSIAHFDAAPPAPRPCPPVRRSPCLFAVDLVGGGSEPVGCGRYRVARPAPAGSRASLCIQLTEAQEVNVKFACGGLGSVFPTEGMNSVKRAPRSIIYAVGATAMVVVSSLMATPVGATAGDGVDGPATTAVGPLGANAACRLRPTPDAPGRTFAVSGNWDGVGGDGIGIVTRTAGGLIWKLRNSPHDLPAEYVFTFGPADAVPVVADWDGAGGDGIGYVRVVPGGLEWTVRNGAAGGTESKFNYGASGDIDFVFGGNWDGVGGAGPGVLQSNGQFHLRNSPTSGGADFNVTIDAGFETGSPVVGNWDGAGGDSIGLYTRVGDINRTRWAMREFLNSGPPQYGPFDYGTVNGCPVTGNWDGQGGDGIGIVYRHDGFLEWELRDGPGPGAPGYDFNYGSA